MRIIDSMTLTRSEAVVHSSSRIDGSEICALPVCQVCMRGYAGMAL